MFQPVDAYSELLRRHQTTRHQLQQRHNRLGWVRLSVILVMGALAFALFNSSVPAGIAVVVAGFALFLWVVSIDTDNDLRLQHTARLVAINEEELALLRHDRPDRYDGKDLEPAGHPYAADLDLFGTTSVYAYIQRCQSDQGRRLLADAMLQPVEVPHIHERQAAAEELAPLLDWRQQWRAYGAGAGLRLRTQQRLQDWLAQEEGQWDRPLWRWLIPVYTTITLGIALATVVGWIPAPVFSFLFLVFLILSSLFSKAAVRENGVLSGIVGEVDTFARLVGWLEQGRFKSARLQGLQASLGAADQPAGARIKVLRQLLNRFDLRLNVFVFIFLNSFLLWDLRQLRALNRWKQQNRTRVPHWFGAIAEMEVLDSFASLRFNHPGWCWPQFETAGFLLAARSAGHPLIPGSKRVPNDFYMEGRPSVAVITGSNMAGKSTFLRSLGVNMVLAQAGAPVCASHWRQSHQPLISSMRVGDNLAEQTSTFYAELKKLKTIIEAVRTGAPIFILLDEILRGTNSLDRHTGSRALIRQLVRERGLAVLATHDVELAQTGQEFPQAVHNYHFDVQVEGEELYFDYRIKEGVCTSLNASLLMKKIGIELP